MSERFAERHVQRHILETFKECLFSCFREMFVSIERMLHLVKWFLLADLKYIFVNNRFGWKLGRLWGAFSIIFVEIESQILRVNQTEIELTNDMSSINTLSILKR